MRTNYLMALALLFLLAAGCGRSGFKQYPFKVSKKDPNLQALIGRWEYLTVEGQGKTVTAARMGSPVVEFGKRGHFEATYGDSVQTGTWAARGDTIYSYLYEVELHKMIIEKLNEDMLIFENMQNGYRVTCARLEPETE